MIFKKNSSNNKKNTASSAKQKSRTDTKGIKGSSAANRTSSRRTVYNDFDDSIRSSRRTMAPNGTMDRTARSNTGSTGSRLNSRSTLNSQDRGASRYGGSGASRMSDRTSSYSGGTYNRTSSRSFEDDYFGMYEGGSSKNTKSSSAKTTAKKSAKAKKSNASAVLINILRLLISPTPQFKLNFFFVLCMAMLIVLIGRIAYWKIAYGTEFEAKAINQQVNKVNNKIISPNRGDILDRNNEQLAIGETVFNVILDVKIFDEQDAIDKDDVKRFEARIGEAETPDDKKKAQDKYEMVVADTAAVKTKAVLKEICGISEEKFNEYVAKNDDGTLKNDTNYLTIAKKIPYEKGKAINDLSYSWLYAEQDTKRTYPFDGLAAQVIGFIRGDTSTGLENEYNDEMSGTPGRVYRTYESDNSVMTQQEAPKKGNTLITTLDVNLQKFAEQACKGAYDAYNPEYTATIIMNPKTGEVYAMAQYPTFSSNDPMKLSDLTNAAKKTAFDAATEDDKLKLANKAWKNFSITETFEPGSIFKPIVVAMALEEGVISINDNFVCGGVKKIGGYDIHCHNRSGHGTLSVEQVLAQSCNVGMMSIIEKLGKDKYYKYQQEFGYGEKTGIDLPAESSAASLIYDYDNINDTELATCSFGQGFNCTAIQALTAFNAVINGGNIMQPYVVSQIVDQEGNVVKETRPHIVRKVISQETSDEVRKALEAVVQSNATGKRAVIKGYAIGGKTGTAEQGVRYEEEGGEYTLNFIGYHSVEDPDICVMTIIHKPPNYTDSSGISPAPMLKEVFEKIINYESIPPDYEGEAEIDKDINSITVKNYTNTKLKDTINDLINSNIDFNIIGSGDTVIKQAPVAGSKLTPGTDEGRILLNLSDSGKSKLAAVPDVTGLTSSSAKQTLEAAGFKCYIEEAYTAADTQADENDTPYITKSESDEDKKSDSEEQTEAEKSVITQMPFADTKIEKGTTVKITVQ